MTQGEADKALLEAAKELHFAAGEAWKKFITALTVAERVAADDLVRAPQESLTRAQGRAQMIRDFRVLLEKAQ